MPSASFLFLLFLYFRKIYFWKYSRNWTKIYGNFLLDGKHQDTKEEPGGPHIGQGRPPAAAKGPPTCGTRPCPVGTPSPPSDAYKLPHDLKTSRRPLFSRNSTRHAITENPSSGSNLKLIPTLCRRGDRSRRALHRHAFLRDEL